MPTVLKKNEKKNAALSETEEFNLVEIYDLFQDLPLEIAIYDINGKYKFVNKLYINNQKIRKSIIGNDDDYYVKIMGVSPESIKKRKEYFQRVLNEKQMISFTEKLYLPEKKKTLFYKRHYKPLFSDKKTKKISSICSFGKNMSIAVLGQKELKYMAYHDMLTGLKNRYAFHEYLNQIIIDLDRDFENNKTAVLFCNIDNFKVANDSLGHSISDLILQEAASRIKSCLRKSDIAFRMGGDDFIIIVKNLKEEYNASKVAEKLISDLSGPYHIQDHEISYLTVSIGIVLLPKDGTKKEVVVKNADAAIYEAKKRGKNNYQFFSKEMTATSVKKLKIENDLKQLIGKKDFENQFKILYQPIVAKNFEGSYNVIGSEALIRWHNPELGLIDTETFINIAEKINLISNIGYWVLEKAVKDFVSISKNYDHPLYISINFSAKQLTSPNMIKKLEQIIKNTGVDPADIQLELTETSYLGDHTASLENINELAKLGIKLAIDDFGVGFASLSYLHKIPASTIKIDRSFIQYISISKKHKELVKSIITLGYNLKKDVIAEGIERLEDLYLLNTLKCFKYQGYLFSRPISLSKFEEYLKKERLLTTVIA